jgi:ribosomal protein L11 methyltransferase
MLYGKSQSLPEVLVESVPHQDWNRQWAESVKPLWIGRRIVIRPSWEPVAVRSDQIEIILDPKRAFGTGHHPTTRMLLEWLEDLINGGESVLDVGTGSAVLAMVALRLGAARATGLDNDPVAIACAEEYARENRFGRELILRCGTVSKGESCDLVLANLDCRTLLLLADDLVACTMGRLLVSGLLVEQRQDIVGAFGLRNLYPASEREMAGWLAVEFGRAQDGEGSG